MNLAGFLKLNPSAILFGVNAVIAAAVSWGAPLSPDKTAAILTGTTAVLTIITTLATRPVGLQLIVGAVASFATAAAAFGLHLSTEQIGAGSTVLSIVLAGVFHLAHTPVTAAKQGTTATDLALAPYRASTPPAPLPSTTP